MSTIVPRLCVAAAAALAFVAPVHAQTKPWPQQGPIRMLVGVPPAGTADPLARAVSERLSKRLGQTIVVENKTGANQAIARRDVANAPADGYTLIGIGAPTLYAQPTPDVGKELTGVALLAMQPMIIAGTTKRDTPDLKALIAAAKAHPDQWSFASAGVASSMHIAGEFFNMLAGTKIAHVPYRGGGPAMNDAVSGAVPLIVVGVGPVIPQVASGALRGYALTTRERSTLMPGVPTLAELGFPDFDLAQWFAVLTKAGVDPAIVERLNREINEILREPDMVAYVEKFGATPAPMSVAQFNAFYLDEIRKWSELTKKVGIPVQ